MTCGGRAPRDFQAVVRENRPLGGEIGLLTVSCPEIASAAEPGQFVMVRSGTERDPFLGRPLAVAGAGPSEFTMVYKVVGRGTELLSRKIKGEALSVRGPIGRGFFSSRGVKALPDKVILVGGALGAAPLLFAAQRLEESRRGKILMGVARLGWEGFAHWLKEVLPTVEIFSDDGRVGSRGRVLIGLPDKMPENTEIWACGPEAMLRALAAQYPRRGEQIKVALEARMACGMGGCLGCVIPTVGGHRRVCVDGPVFGAEEVLWNELRPL